MTQIENGVLTVAGMAIQTDATTVFDGVSGFAGVREDMAVMVWGLQAGANGWKATRLARVVDVSTTAATGRVVVDDGHFYINDLRLYGAAPAALTQGAWVRVQGQSTDGERLALESVQVLQGGGTATVADGLLEVEGCATSELRNGQFQLGQWLVDVSAIIPAVTVTVGDRMEASGTFTNGVLRARTLHVDQGNEAHELEIEARIETYTSLANFVLRGQRCDASGAAMADGVARHLAQNVKVKVIGSVSGDVIVVQQLELA